MTADRDKYVLAIDLGTGGPKVALISVHGEIAGHEVERTALSLLPNGGAEQDPDDWWRAISTAATRLLARGLVPPGDIVAIACTAQWMGTVAVGGDGRPLMNAIIWMDTRGAKQAQRITRGLVNIAGYGPTKLYRWLRLTGGVPSRTGKDSIGHILYVQHELPEVYRQTSTFLEPIDYLNFRLTGRAVASYDTIAGHWLTDNRDLRRVRYVDGLVRLSGIDREKLPELVPTGTVIGTITPEIAREFGLNESVQVVTGTPDTASAAVGSGAVRNFEPHLYIGTSSWLTCHVPFKRTDVIHSITTLPSAIPGRSRVATEQDTAGACLIALRDQLFAGGEGSAASAPDDAFDEFNRAAQRVPPGSDKLIFTPWLNGERTPVEDHLVRGGFFNLSLSSTRGHLIRAVFEGVAYNTRWMLETVERFVKRRLEPINFIGGGAKSNLWAQVHADVLDRRVRQMNEPRLANVRGAACAASVALGHITFEQVPGLVEITAEYEPDPANRTIYDELYAEFLQIYRNNRRMYARLNAGT